MFHRHQWSEYQVGYAPPSSPPASVTGYYPRQLERIVLGVTTIVLRCSCGDMKTVEYLGNEVTGAGM
mgnify:CR=1 FL=1